MSTTSQIKYYNVAFLTYTAKDPGWELNLSSVGGWYPGKGWMWGDPKKLVELFKKLQADGARILLSFGGATFRPKDVVNSSNVDALAQAIAYSFLGGAQPPESPFSDWKRAFTDPDWHFDGIDVDLEREAGPSAVPNSVWVTFARSIKKYAPEAILAGAPQSPYLYNTNVESPYGVPFPGAWKDTCGNVSAPVPGDFLLSTTNVHLFDALFVQFYNQGGALEFPPALALTKRAPPMLK